MRGRVAGTRSIAPRAVSDAAKRAHAQKNQLTIIHAVSQLIRSELTDRGRDLLVRLDDAVERMTELLDADLHGGSAPEAPVAPIEVASLVGDVVAALAPRADAAGVALVVDCRGGLVRGDRVQLAQALTNVIGNAIEATPPGASVRISTASIGGRHRWTIEDSGPGFTPAIFEQVGVPYRTSRPSGSGLGVAITAAIVGAHGGTFSVESRPTGAIAVIELPATVP